MRCSFVCLAAVVGIAISGEPDDMTLVPCTIMTILQGRREESTTCNLKMLLIRQMQPVSRSELGIINELRTQNQLPEKKNYFPLETCEGAGSVCRSRGRRTCICPSSYVCDPFDSRVHICVKLRYLAQMEEMR